MQLLGCFEWLVGCCYVVCRVFQDAGAKMI